MPDESSVVVLREEKRKRPSIFNDPINRVLAVLIALTVIGALLTVVFALMNRVIDFDAGPSTLEERNEAYYEGQLGLEESAQAYSDYIVSLLQQRRIIEARGILTKAQELDLDVTQTQGLLFAEAQILRYEGRLDDSFNMNKQVTELLMDAYETEVARGGERNWALSGGIPNNYYLALLEMASIRIEQENWSDALVHLNTYLEDKPSEAGVLVDRGNVNLELGNNEAARADFEAARRYLGDDPEILEGLERAGASN